MSTNAAPEIVDGGPGSPGNSAQILTPDMAKMMGIQYDPANPMTLNQAFAAQFASSMEMIRNQTSSSSAQIAQARDKILNRNASKLTPEQQKSTDVISKILGMYPQFIQPIYLTLAVLVSAQQNNEKLLNTYLANNPTKASDVVLILQKTLMDLIPPDQWPPGLASGGTAQPGPVYSGP